MASLHVAALDGGSVAVPQASVDALASGLVGGVLTPEDSGYEEAREIWNAMIERRPALIARCQTPYDVVRCVGFAREHGVLTSIRGGGHNIAGAALADEGFTIDLSAMSTVDVDPADRRVVVGPGATLGDLDAATLAHGLAVPVGINSTTGVAGLTLGGGFGWLSRSLGLTVDSLRAADVVTADGSRLRATQDEHPDLFWGLRGGGGNFGVVTSFEFEAHPVGPELLCGLVVHPLGMDVLEFYREFAGAAPDELTVWAVVRHAPPLPFLAEEDHGRMVVALALVDAGDPEEAGERVRPLLEYGDPLGTHVGPAPFAEFQQAFDPLLTPGSRNYWKSHNFSGLADGLLEQIAESAADLPTPQTEIFVARMGGEQSRIPAEATAYPHRDAEYVMNVHTRWEDPDLDASCREWARAFYRDTEPFATGGVYVNFVSDADQDEQVRSSYGRHMERLRDVKREYDPENLFRVNQNIRP